MRESLIIKIVAVVYDLLHRLFCSEMKEEYANRRRIIVKHWSIISILEQQAKAY